VSGLFLGWLGWPAVATGTGLAFAAASLAVLVVRFATARRGGLVLAMAAFMSAGTVAVVLVVR